MATADRNQRPIVDRTKEVALPTEAQDKAPTRAAEFGQIESNRASPVTKRESFSDLIYDEQTQLAERELASFVSAVMTSYGAEQARLSAEDWLDELGLIDSLPLSKESDWRVVTIVASVRLAARLNTTASQ
jgi:hypothetical protein